MHEIVIATGNRGKVDEFGALLDGLAINLSSLRDHFDPVPDIAETGESFEANALLKAQWVQKRLGGAVLADDSGLEVDALNGAPGVYSARFAGDSATDSSNVEKLLGKLTGVPPVDRTARFRCVLVLLGATFEPIVAHGVCDGTIGDSPRGTGGFGYDPVFMPAGFHLNFAEMTPAVKDAISHRGKAVLHLRKELVRLYGRSQG